MRRANKIRARLGWEPGIFNGPGWRKPKGMHQRTYERLAAEVGKWTEVSLAGMKRRFGVGPEEW